MFQHFSAAGKVHSVSIARKKDPKNPGQFLSMGYGFVQYYKKEHANEALKNLQVTTLDGKSLELKRSERGNTLVSTYFYDIYICACTFNTHIKQVLFTEMKYEHRRKPIKKQHKTEQKSSFETYHSKRTGTNCTKYSGN